MTRGAVDWPTLLDRLDAAGVNLPAVAAELDVPYKTLYSVRTSQSNPRYETGRALVALWARVCGTDAADPPRRKVRDVVRPR